MPQPPQIRPKDVPMNAGEAAAFFTIALAEEERYWFAEASESHLTARLGGRAVGGCVPAVSCNNNCALQ